MPQLSVKPQLQSLVTGITASHRRTNWALELEVVARLRAAPGWRIVPDA